MERKMRFGKALFVAPVLMAGIALGAPPPMTQTGRALPASAGKLPLEPRTGAGQAIYTHVPGHPTYEGVEGEFIFPLSFLSGEAPGGVPCDVENIAGNMQPVGTERGLVRYTFWVCDDMDAAFNMPTTYTVNSGLYTHSRTVCGSGFGCADQLIPGTECSIQVTSISTGLDDIQCQELECRPPKAADLDALGPDTADSSDGLNMAIGTADWFTGGNDVDGDGFNNGVWALFLDMPATGLGNPNTPVRLGTSNGGWYVDNECDPLAGNRWVGTWSFGGGIGDSGLEAAIYADVLGACCFATSCLETTTADCAGQGGTFKDDGAGGPATCGPDLDGDGVFVRCENCVGTANPGQEDCDGDGIGDACEGLCSTSGGACTTSPFDPQSSCPTGETCDANVDDEDGDGDGVCNGVDPCPLDNPDDTDGDGQCDSDDTCPFDADNDKDGDGICGDVDTCPNDADNDKDGDGLCDDGSDPCPNDADNDKDGDGQCCGDIDECCNDPDKVLEGVCGCFVPDTDSDGDTVPDCIDICTDGNDLIDTDGDGVPDFCDGCPLDAPNDDTDGDGVCNSDDLCEGADDNVDADGNAIPDCLEAIPTVSTWGLVVMTLMLLVAWKVYFGRRQQMA